MLVNRQRSLLRRAAVEARSLAGARPVDVVPPVGNERAILVLRYKEDLTEAEVARLLGVPVGTVRSASHHALARPRERLYGDEALCRPCC